MLEIDYKKYKRFFAFGCSFTNNIWPTWANLISLELPEAEFYNFGSSGAGNQFISSRISEVNNRYHFTEDDLIIILWTTFSREDRFVDGKWCTYGSVFFSDFYDKNFIEKYFDYTGSIIRDLALIDLTKGYLKSLPCDYYDMLSVFPHTDERVKSGEDVYKTFIDPVYKKVLENYKISYYDIYPWNEKIVIDDNTEDTHPSPLKAYEFLVSQGYNLSEKTKAYAELETKFLKNPKERQQTIRERYMFINKYPKQVSLFPGRYGPTRGFLEIRE